MKLYCVYIIGVFPNQCVTVLDNEERAQALSAFLNERISDHCRVKETQEFFPSHMCEADTAWLKFADEWLAKN